MDACSYDEYHILKLTHTLSMSRLGAVMCFGVTAGAYIVTLFAVSCSPSTVASSIC